MKSSKAALLALPALFIFLFMPVIAGAATFGSGNGFKYAIEDGSATITQYYRSSGPEIEVPGIILTENETIPVNTIASGAFSKERTPDLVTVMVPSSVVTIEDGAIPDGITVIRNYKTDEPYSYVQGRVTEGKSDDGFTYRNEQGSLTITGYEGAEKEIVIPKKIANCRVVNIASDAFRDKPFNKISVPKGVAFEENALLGNYQIILDYDSENPIVIGTEPAETVSPTVPAGTGKAEPSGSEEPSGEEMDVSFPPVEDSTEEPLNDVQPSYETEPTQTEPVQGPSYETDPGPKEPADTPVDPGENGGLRPLDWVLIALAGAVFLTAVSVAAVIILRRKKNR